MTMTNPTDKATVAKRWLSAWIPANFQIANSDAGAMEMQRAAAADALPLAQGDGMRDALVKAREWIANKSEPYRLKDATNETKPTYSDMIREWGGLLGDIDAALAPHPDCQPGMTDEEAQLLFEEETAKLDMGVSNRAGKAAIAAIKRASQRQ